MLLRCNYHLINKHYVTNSMVYFAKAYHSDQDEFQSRRDAAKIAAQTATNYMSKEGQQLIKEYCRAWQLASPSS
ncbi:hypothetical protein H6G76_26855 [Nostoc sp. FACHB-152]|nr:hypothetical protein [Nostoc sp. FACHB-152]